MGMNPRSLDVDSVPRLAGRTRLREQVVASLRQAIAAGEMIPGVTYSAPVLAERFHVSATPVREAMIDLIKEGMVVTVPNKGFRVVDPCEEDLDEVTQLQMLLEVPTVGRLAETITADQLGRLRAVAAVTAKASTAGDLVAYLDADREFHLQLMGITGNRRLTELVDQLRMTTRLYAVSALEGRVSADGPAGDHADLLDALEARDRDLVERVMTAHLGHVRDLWNRLRTGAEAQSPPAFDH